MLEKINISDFDQETIRPVMDKLIYKSYCYNRRRSPEITPDKWVKVFGFDTYLMELKYQQEAN